MPTRSSSARLQRSARWSSRPRSWNQPSPDHSLTLEQRLHAASKALVLGIGGGGDVVGALAAARLCQAFDCEFVLGGVAWERTPIDPHPGPRRLYELRGADPLSSTCALATERTTTPEGVPFSESRMAGYLCSSTVLVDVWPGPQEVARGLAGAARKLACDLVFLVDVGGDVIAEGTEPTLASPLCDAVMLAAGAALSAEVPTVLGVAGPGCDGELTPAEVMLRSAALARSGAWLGAWGIGPAVADQLEAAAGQTGTEASAQIVRCVRGEVGRTAIRGGRRVVELTPMGALLLIFDAATAARACPLAAVVAGAASLEDAHSALLKRGVRSELTYERERDQQA